MLKSKPVSPFWPSKSSQAMVSSVSPSTPVRTCERMPYSLKTAPMKSSLVRSAALRRTVTPRTPKSPSACSLESQSRSALSRTPRRTRSLCTLVMYSNAAPWQVAPGCPVPMTKRRRSPFSMRATSSR